MVAPSGTSFPAFALQTGASVVVVVALAGKLGVVLRGARVPVQVQFRRAGIGLRALRMWCRWSFRNVLWTVGLRGGNIL